VYDGPVSAGALILPGTPGGKSTLTVKSVLNELQPAELQARVLYL
jgi:hypothetical protein